MNQNPRTRVFGRTGRLFRLPTRLHPRSFPSLLNITLLEQRAGLSVERERHTVDRNRSDRDSFGILLRGFWTESFAKSWTDEQAPNSCLAIQAQLSTSLDGLSDSLVLGRHSHSFYTTTSTSNIATHTFPGSHTSVSQTSLASRQVLRSRSKPFLPAIEKRTIACLGHGIPLYLHLFGVHIRLPAKTLKHDLRHRLPSLLTPFNIKGTPLSHPTRRASLRPQISWRILYFRLSGRVSVREKASSASERGPRTFSVEVCCSSSSSSSSKNTPQIALRVFSRIPRFLDCDLCGSPPILVQHTQRMCMTIGR